MVDHFVAIFKFENAPFESESPFIANEVLA